MRLVNVTHLETADSATELPQHGERDERDGAKGQDPPNGLGVGGEGVAAIVGRHVAGSQEDDDTLWETETGTG